MNLGTIVEYEGHRWRVYKLDHHVKTVTLIRWDGTLEEIANDDVRAVVVANPSEWPLVTARVKPNAGPLVSLSLTRGTRRLELKPLVDWVPSDMGRAGGSIFMGPHLKLVIGETLLAQYKDGSATRIVITKRYGSMRERQNRRSGVTKKKGLLDVLEGDEFVE